MNLSVHTVILLVGPTQAGKSTFANRLKNEIGATVISSDEIRRDLIGDASLGKYDQKMLRASRVAFDLLHKKLDCFTTYPINAPFVVVDTTGLSESFRNDILRICEKNNYRCVAVLFHYKSPDEYLKGIADSRGIKKTLFDHIDRMNTEVKPGLKRKDFFDVFTIGKKEEIFSTAIEIADAADYQKTQLPAGRYAVIGDIHGCYETFKSLLSRITNGTKIILAGDIVDKGERSKECLELIGSIDCIRVLGNHEEWDQNYFNGVRTNIPEEIRLDYFSDSEKYKNDDEFKRLLASYIARSTRFVETPHFLVTHAPCEMKHLGKLSELATNSRHPKGMDVAATEEHFKYLVLQADKSQKFHVFGHLTSKKVIRIKNKIGIDTGAVYGGDLTALVVDEYGKISYLREPCRDKKIERTLVSLFEEKIAKPVETIHLAPDDLRRIERIKRLNLNFLSGTMSPGPANRANGTLEAIEDAVSFYFKRDVKEVVLQPKYMGSRCNLYLFPDRCFAVSRRGYSIMPRIAEAIAIKFDWSKYKKVVLDGELLPWSALGAGLIEDHFESIRIGLTQENQFLQESGFETALAALRDHCSQTEFHREKHKVAKETLRKKYGNNIADSYYSLDKFKFDPAEEAKGAAIYSEQLDIYNQDSEPVFKPFAILKEVLNDDSEIAITAKDNYEMFTTLSQDECLLLHSDDPAAMVKAKEYYSRRIAENCEGVVVKPRFVVDSFKSAPFLKVRNERYLTLIYGPNYLRPENLQTFIEEKNIGGKLKTSLSQFKIGCRLLEMPESEIGSEPYTDLVKQYISTERNEAKFDPKL